MNLLTKTFSRAGQQFVEFAVHLARICQLCAQTLVWIFIGPLRGKKIRWHLTFIQIVRIGVNSVPITGIIIFCVGLIIAMQSAYQLERFGATIYVADLVGVSMTRELGPLITAIVIAGRSGAAIAAEIGTMKVAEEIDALKTMAMNPLGYLVVPRTLAMLIVLPCLTILADMLGILGGMTLAVVNLKIPFIAYFNQTASAILMKDFLTGLVKSFFFAIIISQIGVYQGFSVSGGAEGVGKSTTASVVSSSFLIILADLLFTMLFYSTL